MNRAATQTDEAEAGSSINLGDLGRADLIAWEQTQPENYFESDFHLKSAIEFYWAHLAREAESEAARGVDLGKREVIAWLWEKHLGTNDRDPDRYLAQIAKIGAVM